MNEIGQRNTRASRSWWSTTSVAKSEKHSRLLKKKGIKHNVLNAVNHEAEASIIAQAGRFEAVTIATNMAGRGTDILLGGNPEFLARSDMENEWISRVTKLPRKARHATKTRSENCAKIRGRCPEGGKTLSDGGRGLSAAAQRRPQALHGTPERDSRRFAIP